MIKTLFLNFKINSYYTINSYIYNLRKLPVMKDLLEEDAYKYNSVKVIGFIFGLILSIFVFLTMKLTYFGVIYLISKYIPGNTTNHFIYIYFVLSILGMLINSRSILFVSTNKYFSLFLFDMDPLNYTKATVFKNIFEHTIFNILVFSIFNPSLHLSLLTIALLVLCNVFFKICGEAFNLYYINLTGISWYSGVKKYFGSILIFFLIGLTCYFFDINNTFLIISTILLFILSVISYLYIVRFKNYHLFYKRLVTYEKVMGINTTESLQDSIYDIKIKDKNIHNEKFNNKSGYDLFNSLFFYRHRDILYRNIKLYSGVLIILYLVIIGYSFYDSSILNNVNDFLVNKVYYFPLIMYFVNSGSLVTQAMFHNCDHAMLGYNFYKEKDVVIGLFKKRLISIIKSNIIPSLIICIGNTILLFMLKISVLTIVEYFVFVMFLGIFFSIFYLTIYYLFQPYNKDMKQKDFRYSLFLSFVLVLCFVLIRFKVSGLPLIIGVFIFGCLYIINSLLLVNRIGYKTFKINK